MDWNTKLIIKFKDDQGVERTISPIDSFSPSFTLAAEPIHSIEQTHIGVIYQPKTINFSITVKAIGDVVARLTALAVNGNRFEISMLEDEGTDWAFSTVVLSECIITSCSPSTVSPSGAPGATFSGFSLQSDINAKAGVVGKVSVP